MKNGSEIPADAKLKSIQVYLTDDEAKRIVVACRELGVRKPRFNRDAILAKLAETERRDR